MVGTALSNYLPGNVIFVTVGVVYLQPEYELPISTHFGYSTSVEKCDLGNSPQPPQEKNLHEF